MAKALALAGGPSGSRLIGQAMVSAVNLLIALIVGRVFGSAVFGVYSFYALVALMLVNFLIAAFVEPATSISAAMEPDERRAYFSALGLTYGGLLALCALPAHFVLAGVQDLFFEAELVNDVLVTAFVLALVSAGLLRAFLSAFAAGPVILTSDLVRSTLALIGLLVAALAPGYGYTGDPYASVIALQLAAVALYLAALAAWAGIARVWGAPDFSGFARHRVRSGMTTVIAGLRFMQVNAPLFWAQYLLGEQAFGVIRTYQTFANFVSLPVNALRLQTMSTGASAFVKGGLPRLLAYLGKVLLRLTALAAALGIGLLILFAILPGDLRPDQQGFVLLILFVVFNIIVSANTILSSYFFARGRLGPLVVRTILSLGLAVVVAPVMIARFEGLGTPITMVLVAVFLMVLTVIFIQLERRNAP